MWYEYLCDGYTVLNLQANVCVHMVLSMYAVYCVCALSEYIILTKSSDATQWHIMCCEIAAKDIGGHKCTFNEQSPMWKL